MRKNPIKIFLISLIVHCLNTTLAIGQSNRSSHPSTPKWVELEQQFARQPNVENATQLTHTYCDLAQTALNHERLDSMRLWLAKCQETWLRVVPQKALTKAKADLSVGEFYDINRNYKLADSFYILANKWLLQTDSLELIGMTRLKQVNIYQMRGMVQKALKLVKVWETKVPAFTNKQIQADAFQALGYFYLALDKPETALLASHYFKRALAAAEEIYAPDHPKLSRYLSGLHQDYRNRNKIDSALLMLKRMEDLFPRQNIYAKIWVLMATADAYMTINDVAAAKRYLNRTWAMLQSENLQETDDGQYTMYLLAKVAMAEGRFAEAEDYLKRALAVCIKLDYQIGIKEALGELVQVSKKQGKYQAQAGYQEDLLKIELSLAKEGYSKTIADMEVQLNVSEKDSQIKAQQSAQRQLWGGMILAVLVAGLSTWFFFRLRKQSRTLADKNALIDQQNKELTHLDATKTRFFANISHELRTPLTLILGPLSILLKNESLNNAALIQAKLATSNAQNLLKLVNEILDLSKLESGEMQLQETTIHLQPFIGRLVSAFESHAEYLGIHYQLEYKASEWLRLDLDVRKVSQIINNLLSNALKFTPRGGSVCVKIEDLSNVLRLSVSDTGRGIPPADLPHVFNRFYQTRQTDAPIEGGTGIGLALCRELVDVLEGRIWVESEWGKGSQFYVEFPKKEVLEVGNDENTAEAVLATPAGATGSGGVESSLSLNPKRDVQTQTETILIVEDNRDLRAYIADVLRAANYPVLEAENGQQALDLLHDLAAKQQLPQLILSDLMMPVMDGFQLLERLKSGEDTCHLPVIMLTARAEMRDKLKALRIGVDDYLIKPFDEEELLVRIENLLKNQAARRKAIAVEDTPTPEAAAPRLSLSDRKWLETFEAYVQQHYSSDVLSVSALAYQFAMSESTLLRQLKRLTGLSPVQYLQEVRLNEARLLIERRSYNSIAQVASKVGYYDVRSFSRSFRQRFGKLPSEMMNE